MYCAFKMKYTMEIKSFYSDSKTFDTVGTQKVIVEEKAIRSRLLHFICFCLRAKSIVGLSRFY